MHSDCCACVAFFAHRLFHMSGLRARSMYGVRTVVEKQRFANPTVYVSDLALAYLALRALWCIRAKHS